MPTRWLAIAGMVLGISLIGYAVFARETDEEKIFGLLGQIEKAVRVDGDTATNPLIRAGQLKREFSEIFAKNVSYSIPELAPASQGSEDLVALAVRSSVSLTTFDIGFTRSDIRLVAPGTRATASTTVKIHAFRGSEPYEEGERSVRFEFAKIGGEWRVTAFGVGAKQD